MQIEVSQHPTNSSGCAHTAHPLRDCSTWGTSSNHNVGISGIVVFPSSYNECLSYWYDQHQQYPSEFLNLLSLRIPFYVLAA